MNQRIRGLSEQAREYATTRHPVSNIVLSVNSEKFEEKFAELIVRECIEVITTYDLTPGHSAKWEDIYDIHARLLDDLGEELKEHFGVE